MERKLLVFGIGFIIFFVILQIGPIWDFLVNIQGSDSFQAARWIYGAITLNTLTIILMGYLILRKLK